MGGWERRHLSWQRGGADAQRRAPGCAGGWQVRQGKLGSDLPKELQRRQDRLEAISRARKAVAAEAAAPRDRSKQAEAAKELAIEKAREAGFEPQWLERQPADSMPHRGLAHRADGSPAAKAQRNFTDPDIHIMSSDGDVLQGYNCQAVVDGDHQVILAMGVSNQPPDVEHLVAMLERTISNTSQVPRTFIADAGYWSEENAASSDSVTSPHIATGRQQHGQPPDLTEKSCRRS